MWYVRDVLYAVLYVRVSCFVVRGCGVSRRYIDVCYCDMFSVVNVYLDHLKFYVVCINSRRYVCCSECDVVSNVGAVEEMVCVWVLHRGHSGDGCDLASTLCKYDLRKGDLFVLSWKRVRRVRRGSLSSEILMCGGGVRSILLLPLVARCLETIDVCIWPKFVFMSVVVTVLGSVGIFVE